MLASGAGGCHSGGEGAAGGRAHQREAQIEAGGHSCEVLLEAGARDELLDEQRGGEVLQAGADEAHEVGMVADGREDVELQEKAVARFVLSVDPTLEHFDCARLAAAGTLVDDAELALA